jgi:hypothetical protein
MPRTRTANPAAAIAAILAAASLAVSGCTAGAPGSAAPAASGAPSVLPSTAEGRDTAVPREATPGYGRIAGTPAEAALKASRAFFEFSPAAVVVDTASPAAGSPRDRLLPAARGRALEMGVPLLLAGADAAGRAAVREELDRLGARSVVRFGGPATEGDGLFSGLATSDGADPDADRGPAAPTAADGRFAVVHRLGKAGADYSAALATAEAAGASVHGMDSSDPRVDGRDRAFFRDHAGAALYGIGPGLAPEADFASLAATAATGAELPGGGQVVFPERRMVALYGHPETSALGLLGEQGVQEAIRRVKGLAADYQPYSPEPVQPAFEIIATVASAAPGKDGTYSRYTDVNVLRPWVEAAGEAGVYVVLDLQPGRNDFLTQAKRYEELLSLPHVGLAYDPEWRLGPDQLHMAQIGSVQARELNATNAWLADLTRRHRLPQKVVVLHQFQLRMIPDRAALDTGHPELAMVVHADGHGTPGQKFQTWDVLRRDLPKGIRMAWKNFIDEDSPTFTPEETFTKVTPAPWFVSYQ